jgi:hypothetical protein
MVPTVMCQAMLAQDITVGLKSFKAGEIIDLPYGPALFMRVLGGVSAIIDEASKHVEAQEALHTYGGDSWFPHSQQTISRVADYLAQTGAGEQPATN